MGIHASFGLIRETINTNYQGCLLKHECELIKRTCHDAWDDAYFILQELDNTPSIKQLQIEGILIEEGIIEAAAIEYPEGYDGGKTKLAMQRATHQINKLIIGAEPELPVSEKDSAPSLPHIEPITTVLKKL